jgi:hypothetical protein
MAAIVWMPILTYFIIFNSPTIIYKFTLEYDLIYKYDYTRASTWRNFYFTERLILTES